jgi:hypothetical protein
MLKPRTTTEVVGGFTAFAVGPDRLHYYEQQDTVRAYFDGVPGAVNYVRQGK